MKSIILPHNEILDFLRTIDIDQDNYYIEKKFVVNGQIYWLDIAGQINKRCKDIKDESTGNYTLLTYINFTITDFYLMDGDNNEYELKTSEGWNIDQCFNKIEKEWKT